MRKLAYIPLLLVPLCTFSQSDNNTVLPNVNNDFGMWWSASIETKPFRSDRNVEKQFYRKFRIGFEVGHRRVENLLRSQQTYLEFTAKYRIKKWFRVATTYRYSMRDKYRINRHRIVVDANLRKKLKRYSLRYRLRYQHNFGTLPLVPDFKSFRNKLSLRYNIRKFPVDPWLSAEVLTSLSYLGTNVSAVRYQIGAGYTLNKVHSFDVAFRHQRAIGVRRPTYRNIISISYGYYLK